MFLSRAYDNEWTSEIQMNSIETIQNRIESILSQLKKKQVKLKAKFI